jgi:hypothetical protein
VVNGPAPVLELLLEEVISEDLTGLVELVAELDQEGLVLNESVGGEGLGSFNLLASLGEGLETIIEV